MHYICMSYEMIAVKFIFIIIYIIMFEFFMYPFVMND